MTRDLSPIGCLGVITVATRGRQGTGEVLLWIRGGTESYLAWSDEPLPRRTKVLAVDVRGSRTVDVVVADDLGLFPQALLESEAKID